MTMLSRTMHSSPCFLIQNLYLVSVWIHVAFTASGVFFFFFFSFVACVSGGQMLLFVFQGDKRLLFMNSSRIFLTFQPLVISLWVLCTIHRIHKLHFLTTFSLKMSHTALFTHLKIILLQCFQFSVSTK